MRYRKSSITDAGFEASSGASRVVGIGLAESWWPKAIHFASKESPPISAWANNGGPEPAANAFGTAAESAGAPGVSALASGTVAPGVFPLARWIIPVNVMAPTIQVARKAFIAPLRGTVAERTLHSCSP
jgi:hypothetical protein